MGSKKHKKHKTEGKAGSIEHESETGSSEKPLKLVLNLKVGGQQGQESLPEEPTSPSQTEERRHKHKKKKKKKSSEKDRDRPRHGNESLKRSHEDEDSGDDDEEEEDEESMMICGDKEESQKSDEESDGNSSPSRRLRERAMRDDDGAILKQMLNYLLKTLQNKDVNGFFAFPVTDSIAPGYSSIILHPMDFSTMASKIEGSEYINVMEFKKDFILMCNNAMTYNRPDTIYYKEAKRLMHLGVRQLSKEKLLHLKKTHSFLASITLKELGFDESGHIMETPQAPVLEVMQPQEDVNTEPEINRVENEEEAAQEILELAKKAAEEAQRNLIARKPKTDLGFLRMEEDGTTSMTILNPWNDGKVSSTQRVISLGDYMGKLKNGTGSLFKFKEDKRNKVCPETYLCYGPFSSHAPAYDSSFATCTKEESDLLLATYGGETGVQYAKSVEKFVETAGLSAQDMVDKLLDTLTNGQHSKAKIIQEQQKRREQELAEKALQDEMIMKAQKAAEEAERTEAAKDPVQRKLNETAAFLSELSDTQNERLSQEPPVHLSFIAQPSDKETNLAHQVTNNLMSMTKQVYPSDVVSTKAVRGAMGITSDPVQSSEITNRPPTKVVGDSEDESSGDDEEDDDGEESKSEEEEEDMATLGGLGTAMVEDDEDGLGLLRQFDDN